MAHELNSQFQLGEMVKRNAFTDCFQKSHEDVSPLIVTDVRMVVCTSMPPYFRLTAESLTDRSVYEGAERFFSSVHALRLEEIEDTCLCGAPSRNGVCSVEGCVCGVRP
jgi:hypothetical protein